MNDIEFNCLVRCEYLILFNGLQTNEWYRIEVFVLDMNIWNHLTVYNQMSFGSFKDYYSSFTNYMYLIYMYKRDLKFNKQCYRPKEIAF